MFYSPINFYLSVSLLYHTIVNKSRRKPCMSSMMHRLRRYDVFRFAQNDVAPLRFTMMRYLPQNVAKPHIIRRSRHHWAKPCIICRRQTSFKKSIFVIRQRCFFCWRRERDSNPRSGISRNTISSRAP